MNGKTSGEEREHEYEHEHCEDDMIFLNLQTFSPFNRCDQSGANHIVWGHCSGFWHKGGIANLPPFFILNGIQIIEREQFGRILIPQQQALLFLVRFPKECN